MNKEQRKILADHTEYIIKRIKQFRFKPPLDIDECTNYVLYKIVDRIGNYNKKINSILPFLNKVTTNLVYDYYRKELRKPHHTESECKILEQIKPDTNSPEKEYWQDKRDKVLQEEIEKLDPENKKIVELYYFSNQTEEQIGRAMGLARNTISIRLKKSLAILKPRIAERLAEIERIREEL